MDDIVNDEASRLNPAYYMQLDAHTLAWVTANNNKLIRHAPSTLAELTEVERHLLINDNAALDLDHEAPTYPADTDSNTRAAVRIEAGHKGGNYVDTVFPQLYTSSHIEASLEEGGAEQISTDPLRMAKFCLQASHLERCYA